MLGSLDTVSTKRFTFGQLKLKLDLNICFWSQFLSNTEKKRNVYTSSYYYNNKCIYHIDPPHPLLFNYSWPSSHNTTAAKFIDIGAALDSPNKQNLLPGHMLGQQCESIKLISTQCS